MPWPEVLDEDQTLDLVLAGASLARFGDGEISLALGGDCITQCQMAPIGASLRAILKYPGQCLVGVPRQGVGPKRVFWSKYDRPEVHALLKRSSYHSAFITRPDSAPWIDRPDYWAKLRSLWLDKDVTLVRGSEKSLTSAMLVGAKSVDEVLCLSKNAYANYWSILERVREAKTVLLCLGPTATVLAAELSVGGVHAIDLGHVGMFLRKHDRGQSMRVTEEEKAVDRVA